MTSMRSQLLSFKFGGCVIGRAGLPAYEQACRLVCERASFCELSGRSANGREGNREGWLEFANVGWWAFQRANRPDVVS